jgi:hypothetical protein
MGKEGNESSERRSQTSTGGKAGKGRLVAWTDEHSDASMYA